MLDRLPVLKSEHLEADLYLVEVVVGVREHKFAIFKHAHDLDVGRCLGEPLEELRQTDVSLSGQGVVLDVFVLVDDRNRLRVAGFNTLEQIADLFFTIRFHGQTETGSLGVFGGAIQPGHLHTSLLAGLRECL